MYSLISEAHLPFTPELSCTNPEENRQNTKMLSFNTLNDPPLAEIVLVSDDHIHANLYFCIGVRDLGVVFLGRTLPPRLETSREGIPPTARTRRYFRPTGARESPARLR